MSCTIGTSPINVTQTNNKCESTCHYAYNYGISSLTVNNKVDHLQFSYDSNSSNVTYNNTKYNVEEIRLYKPSLNKYNGTHLDAELIIHHTGDGANNLLVCIPIKGSNSASTSMNMFKSIIPFSPPKNDSTSINVSNYTLNNFVPKGGYYSYIGTLPYLPCTGKYNIILFDPNIAANMSLDNLRTLGTLIQSLNPTIKNIDKKDLFYNEKGTLSQDAISGDDIYIKCSALDEEGNEIVTDQQGNMLSTQQISDPSFTPSKEREQKILKYVETGGQVLLGVVLMYGLYIGIRKVVKKLSEE